MATTQKIDKLSGNDIAVYALYLLGGWQKRVHTEDVALKCFELAPSKFSWIKYVQYPDIAPARFALEAAKKQKYGALIKGESERKKRKIATKTSGTIGGWMLTSNGVDWVNVNKIRIEEFLHKQIPTGDRLSSDRKIKELIGSMTFKKYIKSGDQAEISHAEFAESLICTVNTKAEILNDRLEQLYSIAKELKREDVKNYINFIRKKFSSLLG
jgi:hypothetical protein